MSTMIRYRNFDSKADAVAYDRAVVMRHGWNTDLYPISGGTCWIVEIHVPADERLRRPVDPSVVIPRYRPIPER